MQNFIQNPSTMKILFGILSVSIFVTVIIFMLFVKKIKDNKNNIVARISRFNKEMYEDTLKKIQKRNATKNLYEHINLLLSRSQLKYTLKLNFWVFAIITLLSFFVGLYSFIDITNDYLTSLLVGIGCGFVPYIAVEVIASIKGKQIKNQILTLIPVLMNNIKLTSGDIFQAIKKTIAKTKEPIKIYLEEFVAEYEAGLKIEKCFENIKNKVMDYRFTRLMDALEIHLFKGGNTIVTLNSMQKEFLAREIEEDRRKKETFANVLGVYLTVLANIVIVFLMSRIMPEVVLELKSSYKNNILLAVILTLISLFMAYKATKVGKK
jgi:Flp pilus assembly protein TadB